MKKTFLFFVGMLFMSFSNPPPTNATFTDFTGLSLDDVRQNHQRLKQSVDNCYKEAKKHFAKIDEPWSNLCAVGVRWVIQTENNRLITDFDIIKDSNKKLLISSNSSSPQWKSSIVDEESFHMLSWPTIDTRDTFNTFDLMVKNMRLPEYLGDITNPLYLTVYPRSLGELKPFLDQIKEIVSKNIPFRNLSSQDKQSLINLGKLFRRQFLHPRRGNPTDYHGGISNLRDFFKAYDQGQLVQEEINIGAIVKPALLQEEKIKFLKENPNSVLSKFSHLLGVDKDTYEGFSANENIINDIRKIYPLDKRNEMDITHSESLLAWWVNRNFIKMRQKIENDFYESGFYKSNQVSPLIDCFPIFFFYTDRQTCPSCENIIQSLAYGNYIPLISFSDIFSPDYAFLSGVRIPVQKSAYTLPYSILPQNYLIDFFLLRKLRHVRKPIDLNWEPFQVDYDRILHRNFSFMEAIQLPSSQKKIESMHSLLSMLESEYNSLKSVLATTSEGKTPKGTSNTETPAYKMFLSILLSQEHIIGWIRDQHATEDKFANETAIFIKNQKDTCNYEHGILADFKRNFQRIPIQYQM